MHEKWTAYGRGEYGKHPSLRLRPLFQCSMEPKESRRHDRKKIMVVSNPYNKAKG